jgi:DNA-binding transcriptional ArsR family regulator
MPIEHIFVPANSSIIADDNCRRTHTVSGHVTPDTLKKRRLIPTLLIPLTLVLYFDSIGNMKAKNVVIALSALAQETRLEIFRLLVRKGPTGMAAGDLSDHFVMPPATMSFHLKELSNARLIASRREGRSIIYSADFERMNRLLGFLMENCCADSEDKCL